MLSTPVLLLALLGPPTGPQDVPVWGDIELPRGFHLDLSTGWVSNRAPIEAERGVVWDGESLRGPALLLLVPGVSEHDRIERGDGNAPKPGTSVVVGDEWVYELGEGGWGYLRALAANPGRISIERAHCDASLVELIRSPAGISWNTTTDSVELSWARSEDEGASWNIDRRALRADGASPWENVGVTHKPWWRDEEAQPDVVLEYRVILEGGGLGSRVRAVAGGLADEAIEVRQGSGINALTGEIDGGRTDLRLEYINPKGVQIGPGEGVILRTLVSSGREAWELPHRDTQGYGPQRYFLSEGRDLALHLPEGLYARVSLGEVSEAKVMLRVSVALDGGRVLLPAPFTTAARGLPDGGAEVTAEVPSGHAGLGLGEPILILEREQGFESGEWVFVTEEIASGSEVLSDPEPGAPGPCRYRSRLRLGPHGPSAPSAPISVLLGDDGGAQTDAWIRDAIAELGQADYARRQRARELLAVVGERARPHLLEVVASENPEQASGARELLRGLGREEEGGKEARAVVPDILLQRASEKGLSEDGLPGFLDDDPVLRAFGALRVKEVDPARDHLEVLAEADPEAFVRDAASMALSLPPRASAPAPYEAFGVQTLLELADELELLDAPDPAHLSDALSNAAVDAETWTALIALQISEDLAASLGDFDDEEAAVSRARLALALLRERTRGRDAPASFLAAALDVVHDPLIRQEAARRFAARVFDPPDHDEQELRIEPGDFDDLASVLDESRRSGEGKFIVIPAGVYEVSSGSFSSLRLGGDGVHLVGEGEVVLHASLVIEEGAHIVLENLRIEPRSGIGITITDGELVLIDCHLTPSSMGIQATDSLVALSNSVIADALSSKAGRGGPISVRLVGLSAFFARDSRIASSAACVHGARFVHLDTCALSSLDRSAVEGQGRMEVFAERALLVGGYAALIGAGSGVLEGVVLESPGHAALRVGEGLHLCREHTSGGDEAGELWTKGSTIDCTLEHR